MLLRPAGKIPSPQETRLVDYRPPAYLVDHVDLAFAIGDKETRVQATMQIRRNPQSQGKSPALELNGENQKLREVILDGYALPSSSYRLEDERLIIPNVPENFRLEVVSTHEPQKNTALSGLYQSGAMLCTQCEAEGFRRITYYPDRPDVMAKFTVRIEADARKFPVLLSNGNLVAKGKAKGGRHWTKWEDPFPKPSYLFALVAGQLEKISDRFTTKSGRRVLLEIYVEPGNKDQVRIAMEALKNSMRWDEDAYGLEYDLDRFMIVAVGFFNMGAMENKGLNIFNTDCVFARPETATDGDIAFVERVVGHEYFHNWTGNRITCRDWFQLSLKEGLTVFREQQFCQAMNSAGLERVKEVKGLRAHQFAEDAGPTAHPVRPASYVTIDNFYTSTIYDKGAELCRMLHTMLGEAGFQRGMKLYVQRHDGQAATCDDFVAAMQDANKVDLAQFKLWYSQSGTPHLAVKSAYDAKAKRFTLQVKQSCPPTPGQAKKKPMHIPLAVGLLDAEGRDLVGTRILDLRKATEAFTFENIASQPVPSLLRGFSAPVRMEYAYSENELLFLLAHDSDMVCRWEAGQILFGKYLLAMVAACQKGRAPDVPAAFLKSLAAILHDDAMDPAFAALLLSAPSEMEVGLMMTRQGKAIDVEAIHAARTHLRRAMGVVLEEDLRNRFDALKPNPRAFDGTAMGQRSLKNLCLGLLASSGAKDWLKYASAQATSLNMSDQVAALAILAEHDTPLRDKALNGFYRRWKKDDLIVDKWFAAQAASSRPDTLKQVRTLLKHPAFDRKNPNKVRALIGSFVHGNQLRFHAADGSGYKMLAKEIITIDKLNPQMASRLAQAFERWRDFDRKRQALMKAELKDLAKTKGLSRNCAEIVTKTLAPVAKG